MEQSIRQRKSVKTSTTKIRKKRAPVRFLRKRKTSDVPLAVVKSASVIAFLFFLYRKFPSFSKSSKDSPSSSLLRVQRSRHVKGESSFIDVADPNLFEMKFTLPNDEKEHTFLAYKVPDVSTFYKEDFNNGLLRKKIHPEFKGMAGKFINMSSENLVLYW